ncbi:MAG: hypothetical protein EOO65_05800, partial [Methanosarcinales archaeon]
MCVLRCALRLQLQRLIALEDLKDPTPSFGIPHAWLRVAVPLLSGIVKKMNAAFEAYDVRQASVRDMVAVPQRYLSAVLQHMCHKCDLHMVALYWYGRVRVRGSDHPVVHTAAAKYAESPGYKALKPGAPYVVSTTFQCVAFRPLERDCGPLLHRSLAMPAVAAEDATAQQLRDGARNIIGGRDGSRDHFCRIIRPHDCPFALRIHEVQREDEAANVALIEFTNMCHNHPPSHIVPSLHPALKAEVLATLSLSVLSQAEQLKSSAWTISTAL